MKTIKLTTPFPEWPLVRQTPDNNGVWDGCRFFVNQEIDECDWWVVYEGLLKPERTKCPPENTILITGEPPTVKQYDKNFVKQFAKIITCHTEIKHPNKILSQQALPWMIGAQFNISNKRWSNFLTYCELSRITKKKTKTLSVVISKGKPTPGHIQRDKFINKLINELGEKIDIYGNGYKHIQDKYDAIVPYKYHLVIENCSIDDYWTEKLADAYIGEAFPIYHGCKNIGKYFPIHGFEYININKTDHSICKIKKLINSNTHIIREKQLFECKDKVLNEYNLFKVISNHSQLFNKRFAKNELEIYPETFPAKRQTLKRRFFNTIRTIKKINL